MNDRNRKLLEDVIEIRLEQALSISDSDNEAAGEIFKEAMEAVDRSIELSKMKAAVDEQTLKLEAASREAKFDRWVKYIEIGAVVIVTPVVGTVCNKVFAKIICEFEKDYTFTTSAGRSLSKLFSFGKK